MARHRRQTSRLENRDPEDSGVENHGLDSPGAPPPGARSGRPTLAKRIEARFERWLWRIRLIAILPVVMSLASTVMTFLLGTAEIAKSILGLSHAIDSSDMGYMAKLLGGVVTGIDLYLIGIALLIFGYGVYELLISPIDPAHQGNPRMRSGLLEISNLDQLKEKLVKVLVVALIVAAFKAMLTLPIRDGTTLALFCLAVLLLALSGYLVVSERGAMAHPRT